MGDKVGSATEPTQRADAKPQDAKQFHRDLRQTVQQATARVTTIGAQAALRPRDAIEPSVDPAIGNSTRSI